MSETPETIRPAAPSDETAIFQLIELLADFEKLRHQVVGSPEQLAAHLFGPRPVCEALVAEIASEANPIVGFALFFPTYSTFRTQPGLWLEDLFVVPEHRRRGIARRLLGRLRAIATERDCGRLEWAVLDWNERAISFYESIGAPVLPDWRTCRIELDGHSDTP